MTDEIHPADEAVPSSVNPDAPPVGGYDDEQFPACGSDGTEVYRGEGFGPDEEYRHCPDDECRVRLFTPYPEMFA